MPKGGFGNLIALPLQGEARRKGNSVFVDENFMPYSDPWRILSRIPKMDGSKLKESIERLSEYAEPLDDCEPTSEKATVVKKQKSVLSAEDFPPLVRIVCSNMISVEKAGLSERALGAIKRMGAYANPEFYKAQKNAFGRHTINRDLFAFTRKTIPIFPSRAGGWIGCVRP